MTARLVIGLKGALMKVPFAKLSTHPRVVTRRGRPCAIRNITHMQIPRPIKRMWNVGPMGGGCRSSYEIPCCRRGAPRGHSSKHGDDHGCAQLRERERATASEQYRRYAGIEWTATLRCATA